MISFAEMLEREGHNTSKSTALGRDTKMVPKDK